MSNTTFHLIWLAVFLVGFGVCLIIGANSADRLGWGVNAGLLLGAAMTATFNLFHELASKEG